MDLTRYENKLPWGRDSAIRKAHREEDRRLHQLFFDEGCEELDIKGHPKASMLCDIAWDQGHAYGYSEVWIHMQQLADLLREINE